MSPSVRTLVLLLVHFCATKQADFQRTIVFIRVDTDLGENAFMRGGAKCSQGSCKIPIRHRVIPVNSQKSSYYTWSRGDNYLDWNGAEVTQQSYHGSAPEGTPLIWTTDQQTNQGPTVSSSGYGYTPLNSLGSNFWMLDIDMDCSASDNGWFEFKSYVTTASAGSWEPDVDQTEACGGDIGGSRPYRTRNHMAKCGKMNVFYYDNYGCVIMNISDALHPHISPQGSACGLRSSSSRIVGGHPAGQGHWPWMSEVMYQGNHGCGAVLLSSRWAVTAGHCVRTAKTVGPWTTILRTGETNRHSISGKEKDYFVKTIIKHPLFDKTKPNHDIALLELLTPVDTTSDDVTPACLPVGFHQDDFVGKDCWAVGWGSTNGHADRMRLQEVQMNVSSESECNRYYGAQVSSRDLCAGLGNISACGGDSGSPLSCHVSGRWYVAGVVSWGDDGCHGRPSVFTRISSYISWIRAVTGIHVKSAPIIG